MAATKQDIIEWLKEGQENGSTHVIVVCDTYDWDDYPVFVKPEEDVQAHFKYYNGSNMQKVMEVYNLSMSISEQLNTHRAMNF